MFYAGIVDGVACRQWPVPSQVTDLQLLGMMESYCCNYVDDVVSDLRRFTALDCSGDGV
jgi:hypothetical protein